MMDKEKDIFELISEICESDNINDAEWVKAHLKKEPPPPNPQRNLLKLP